MKAMSIALAAAALAGCRHTPPQTSPQTPPAPPADPCRADAIGDLIGRAYAPAMEQAARERTGAAALRVIRPGDAVTMDYRIDRLNLELDAQGRLARARCG